MLKLLQCNTQSSSVLSDIVHTLETIGAALVGVEEHVLDGSLQQVETAFRFLHELLEFWLNHSLGRLELEV